MRWGAGQLMVLLTSWLGVQQSLSAESSQQLLDTFQKLFVAKRMEQLQAVKSIVAMVPEKQKSILETVSNRIFEVISRNKVKLESSGYELSPDLPADESIRESLSLLIENTCLFSDLLLRLPDQLTGRLAARRDWDLTYRWALGLVRDLAFLDSATLRLLHLAAQEVGLVPREPGYRNPYRGEKKPQKRFEEPPPPAKKERKKVKRGPKMSHSEL